MVRVCKTLQPLAKIARKQQWTITQTKGGHLLWRSPTGAKVWTACSPSDWRYVDNTRAKLRAKGLEL